MTKRPIRRESVTGVLTWGGLAISVISAVSLLSDARLAPFFWAILALGVAIILFALAVHLSDTVFEWFVSILGGAVLDIRTCGPGDIAQVHQLAEHFFGEGVTEPELIRQITDKYRDGLQVAIGRNGERELTVRGYFFLFPINKRCADRICDFSFEVSSLRAEDIATKPKYGHAIYIGGIAARGVIARAELMGAIKANAEKARQTRSGIAYARAATARGLALLEENGFVPVHPHARDVGCFFKKSFAPEVVGAKAARQK